jgi:hypothetical protein
MTTPAVGFSAYIPTRAPIAIIRKAASRITTSVKIGGAADPFRKRVANQHTVGYLHDSERFLAFGTRLTAKKMSQGRPRGVHTVVQRWNKRGLERRSICANNLVNHVISFFT